MSYKYKPEWAFNKKEKPILISRENKPFLSSYLIEIKKRSDFAYRNQKSVLGQFFEYVYNTLEDKNVVEITKRDVKSYLNDIIDQKELRISSKNSYRSYLSSFFDHVEDLLDSDNIDFRNPVPNKKKYKFTQKDLDVKKQSEKDLEVLTKEEIFKILDFCYKNRKQHDFILIGLDICTGARISEILTIKIKNVNLQERYFETGFEKNARKSTWRSKESLLFFFPERFEICLENCILSLQSLNKDVEWLFPNNKMDNYISFKRPYYLLNILKQRLGINFSYKYFRKTIITERMKMGCPDWASEGLTNHKGSSIQREYYIKLKIPEKRELYDKYFPYYSFPYF